MERAAGFAQDDTVQAKLDKLDALMVQSHTPRQDIALFADMLSLLNDGRYPTLDLTPQQRRQKTLEALRGPVETFAREKPVLMILEDAHWADPPSLEVFGGAVDRAPARRLLLIITFRSEFEPPWIGLPHVTALTLNRLTQREVEAMIGRVMGNRQLAANVRQEIIERTDGIPLFVEEMTKAVLEAESEGEALRTTAAVPSPALAVPASLHASPMARLDRLGPAKEVAQIGSAIGREFSHTLLASVVSKPETELGSALDRLIAAGLLFRQGVPPHASYLFKHALVQDAAYGTLLRELRRALHARIAETLERGFPDIAENQPEILARHCTEAELIEKAASLWGKAGLRSLERSAVVEAVEQLTRGLAQIATQHGTPALRREQIKLQVGLMNALMHTKGHAAQETRAAAERARLLIENAEALGEPPEDPLLLFSVLWGFWVANFVAFNGDVIRELASALLTLAEKQGTIVPLKIAHRSTGISLLHAGDIAHCRPHFDRAIALCDPVEHRQLATRFGGDIGVTILSWRSTALWVLGYPVSARADAEHALSNARDTRHAVTLMYALTRVSMIHVCCGNYPTASAQADELVALADKKGSPLWKAFGVSVQGWLAALTDKTADAVQIITSGIDTARSTGSTLWAPLNLSHLASACADLGKFDDAWRCIGEAMTAMAAAKETWWEAEVNRIAGEVALKSPEPDVAKAQPYFERALAVARQQQAKSWELRASMSLARPGQGAGGARTARTDLRLVH
jgi:predicted ATPase